MKRYTKTIVCSPGKKEIGMEECKGGVWVRWEDVITLLGDDWGVCNRCGNLELVDNLFKVVLADDQTITNFGFIGGLPNMEKEHYNMTLLLCSGCKRSLALSMQEWFSEKSK